MKIFEKVFIIINKLAGNFCMMPNSIRKALIIVFFVGLLSGITGCSRHSFVNDNLFKSSVEEDNTDKGSSLEVINLENGVVMYRDKEKREIPSEYNDYKVNPTSSSIHFGPGEIKFTPKNVNPK